MPVTPQELRDRTMHFALAVFRLTNPLMRETASRHLGLQLFRAATSVAANYRAACLARSKQEFAAKLGIVREEVDEAVFWLEFLQRSDLAVGPDAAALQREALELAGIISAAYRTTKARLKITKLSNQ